MAEPIHSLPEREPRQPNGRPAVRERIAEDAARLYDEKIAAFFEDALSAEKTAWGTCDGCRKRFPVEVPDWNARAKVLELLLNQGYGRPKADEEEARKAILFKRVLVFPAADYEQLLVLCEKHGLGSLRRLPEGGVEVVICDEAAAAGPADAPDPAG
jgi:hypothetical protein